MKKTITVKHIINNEITLIINNEEITLPLHLKYEDKLFEPDYKASIESKINPFNDEVYYTDLIIDNQLYILAGDTKNIYLQRDEVKELNVVGEFPIILRKITYAPKRKFFNQSQQEFMKKYGGFKIDYDFKDNFAKSSAFYLPIIIDSDFKVDSTKVEKSLHHIEDILKMVNVKKDEMEKYLKAIVSFDEKIINDFIDEVNSAFEKADIISYIQSFIKNNNFIVYYSGFKKSKQVLSLVKKDKRNDNEFNLEQEQEENWEEDDYS